MDANYVNAFVKSSITIFDSVAGLKLNLQKPTTKPYRHTAEDVMIRVDIIGEVLGEVIIIFDNSMAKKIASNMMMGMAVEELDEISTSAIKELGNMLMGNAATLLYNENIKVDITPPMIVFDDQKERENLEFIGVPFNTDLGNINLAIYVRK